MIQTTNVLNIVIPIRNRNHTGERFIQSQLQVEETISVLFLSQIGISSPGIDIKLRDVVKNFHKDSKKWQQSNEKSSRRIFWVSIAMIVLAAVQIIVAVLSSPLFH